MLKITKTYTDFDGVERTETAWFNMTKSQLVEFYTELPSGVVNSAEDTNYEEAAAKLLDTVGENGVFKFIKALLLRSYGIRGEDGKSFKKSDAISEEFSQTLLFDAIFMDFMSNEDEMQAFIEGVMPSDLAEKTKKIKKTNK